METELIGFETICDLRPLLQPEPYEGDVLKHGTHDQKTHGNWANGVGENWATKTEKGRTIFSQDRGSKLLEVSIANKNLANPENKKDFEAALSTIDTLNDAFPIRGSVNFGVSDLGEKGRIASTWSTVMEFGVNSPSQVAQISLAHEWFDQDSEIQTHALVHEWGHANDLRAESIATEQAAKFSEARFQDSKIPMTDYGMSSNREAYAEAFAVKFDNSHKGGIYSSHVEQTPRWEDVFKIFELGSVNKSADASAVSFRVWDTFDANNPPLLIENYTPESVLKHGTHDQSTHGSWAHGSEGKVLTSLIDRLAEKKTPGFSIDIRTKKSPKTGFMCSIDGAERQVKLDKWNSVDNDGKRAIIEQYKKDNMGALSKRGAYFGAWKVVQDGVIYLDVSRRYESKSEGIGAGIANRQKSIYDVVKDAYIYMEDENDGTRANKARTGGVGQTSERDDSRGIGRADGRNPDGNRGQSVSFPHICLGRYSVVGIQKHQQHDQSTHGSWANNSGIPAVWGTSPIPKGHVRLFHQTGGDVANLIGSEGIKIDSARFNEGHPTGIFSSKMQGSGIEASGWYGKFKDTPTVEFHVPKEWTVKSDSGIIFRDVPRENIIAVHQPWHSIVRSIVERGIVEDVRAGKYDYGNSDPSFKQATNYIKQTPTQKHLEGQHDQATHGNWAGDRYPADSVKSARDGAKEYAFKKGLNPDETIDYTKVVANRERASKIADLYESLPKMDRDAVDEYEALASEVEEQFNYMTKTLGVKVEFVADDPYKTSKEMFDDVSKGTLKVLQTETTGAHPIFSNEQNNKFRAVHDYFGHAATGRGFGQDGEESAWVHHSQMFTQKATAALTTETRGQNSFFNNRGKQFADQKVALLPEEFWAVPKVFQKGYQVIYFAPGLKPVIKHQEHDQKTHGSWATGISDEDEALINQFSTMGPAKEDILNALGSGEQAGMEDLTTMVNNDQGLYQQATEGIDERVAEALARNQEISPNHEFTEQEKSELYDNVQNAMIDEFIESDDGTIAQMWEEQNGGAFDPEELHSYFDEVYSLEHQVTNNDGEAVTILSSSTTNIYQDGERLVINGEVTDSSGNYAGEFQRSFYKETNNNGEEILVVEHDIFRMADEYQGSGFGSKFLAQQEAYYVSKGIDAINVSTAWDGARHWARAGFDFNPKSVEGGIRSIVNRANEMATLGRLALGTPARQEFDSLMFRTVEQYGSDANGIAYRGVKSMTENNFPTPNDFAMIGYGQRVVSGTSEYGKPIYSWAGKQLLNDLHLKYRKGLTQEGRTLNQGPIDRDGDGLVYDGTVREKPVSEVNSAP